MPGEEANPLYVMRWSTNRRKICRSGAVTRERSSCHRLRQDYTCTPPCMLCLLIKKHIRVCMSNGHHVCIHAVVSSVAHCTRTVPLLVGWVPHA